jgi:hypothetical protein
MVIYLQHPKHGNKVAVSELEADRDELNGWQRYTPEKDTPPVNQLARRKRKEPEYDNRQ